MSGWAERENKNKTVHETRGTSTQTQRSLFPAPRLENSRVWVCSTVLLFTCECSRRGTNMSQSVNTWAFT